MAEDDIALQAAADASELGLAHPILIGDAKAIRERMSALGLTLLGEVAEIIHTAEPAAMAARMAGQGAVDILLKGHLRSDELLHAVLDKNAGLRTGRLLSDILIYEDTLSGFRRLVGITDGGLVVAPNLEQKKQIVLNAIEVMHCLAFKRPKIALMSASEVVSDARAHPHGQSRIVWRRGCVRPPGARQRPADVRRASERHKQPGGRAGGLHGRAGDRGR